MRDRGCSHRFAATSRVARRSLTIVRFPEFVAMPAAVRSDAIGSRCLARCEAAAAVWLAMHIGHFAGASTESQSIPFDLSR
ncbi:hypothetical protein WS71_10885 [Burkholderia mayonis]|uniref:Uncharacterized protein n=1 Tax=Burkholderia mayonis TaxID=1385591 RepID=A0A1B4FVQ4_9BURK|nr:hypothetical protein WS71_10885 [Burkholderia mayonis]KVE50292.1 hypothetical protein WS71_14550 [Burkholderia mayonis]